MPADRVVPVAERPLNDQERAMLRALIGGADIHSDQQAKIVRGLESLGLVTITKPMRPGARMAWPYVDGPWFGAITNGYGRRVLQKRRGKPARRGKGART